MHLFNHRGGISEARDISRKGGKPTCSRLKHEVFESLGSELSWADVYVDGAHSKFHRAVMELLLICDFCGILAAMNRFVFLIGNRNESKMGFGTRSAIKMPEHRKTYHLDISLSGQRDPDHISKMNEK